MALLLGIDTGGTYTDAVLLDDTQPPSDAILASAKSPTTRQDLAVGIAGAVDQVLAATGVAPERIALVSLSTTLATNALVEGQGGRIALILIGFGEAALGRAGLREALAGDPCVLVDGGHDAFGREAGAFDEEALRRGLADLPPGVEGLAVASQFAVRNPAHEIAARDIARATRDLPVTCSHELSSRLDGPRRAMTSVLNARLIGLIHRLVTAAEGYFAKRGISAPLMVVRGDGALVSAAVAKTKPIETILSGPAASLVGASWLTGESAAMVSDIGGTTTDVAVLEGGQPRLDPHGARVGGWQTMVEAVAMETIGLGGDSEVRAVPHELDVDLELGPRRVVPLCMAAADHRGVIVDMLERQLRQGRPGDLDGRVVLPVARSDGAAKGLPAREAELLEIISKGPIAADKLIRVRPQIAALDRLVALGLVQISALTPTDAAHVLGLYSDWDGQVAEKAALLFACKRSPRGLFIESSAEGLSRRVIDALVRASADVVLQTGFRHDGFQSAGLTSHELVRAALGGHTGAVRTRIGLSLPLIGLGASAPLYYPEVARRLGTTSLVPEHAGVANAVGAVVGQVRIASTGIVTQPEPGRYRFQSTIGTGDFPDLDAAVAHARKLLSGDAEVRAREAGAETIEVHIQRADRTAVIEGSEVLIEAEITAVASGRPRIAA